MVSKKILAVFLLIVALIVVSSVGVFHYRTSSDFTVHRASAVKSSSERILQENENRVVLAADEEYEALEKGILDIIGSETSRYSVYFWAPCFPRGILINNQKLRAASMIKVFVMEYAMSLSDSGRLRLDDTLILKRADKVDGAGIICGWADGTEISIGKLVELMITHSDNTATNMLIDYFGMKNIQDYIVQRGYQDSVLQCRMMDFVNPAPGPNYSSVKDLGMFFTKVYNRECINEYYDNLMINILKGQNDREVFPAALPGVEIAHKTGEITGVYDEGGIVFDISGDFVLVIMNHDVGRVEAIKKMQDILLLCNRVAGVSRNN